MPGLSGLTREPKPQDPRGRRNSQALAVDVNFVGDGSIIDLNDDGILVVNLASGTILTDTGDALDVTLGTGLQNDGGTLKTKDDEIVHDDLSGFVADEHVDHSTVSVTGADGIAGGGDLTASRVLTFDGASVRRDTRTVSTTTTLLNTDEVVFADASGGTITLTLPASEDGKEIEVVRTDSASANLVTLDGDAAETINGDATVDLAPGDAVQLIGDGSNWSVK